MMKKIYLLFLTLIFIGINAYAQTEIPGGHTGQDTTWATDIYLSGDFYVKNGYDLTINAGVTIYSDPGIDIFVQDNSILTVNGTSISMVTFTEQTTDTGWGHISFENTSATDNSIIDYCIFENGYVKDLSSTAGYGGAIYIGINKIRISNSEFSSNIAEWGGAIFVEKSKGPVIKRCLFFDNESDNGGGGIYCWDGSNAVIENCIFDSNKAGYGTSNIIYSGGGVSLQTNTNVKLLNCTFVNNDSDENGDGLQLYGIGTQNATNCILWGSNNQVSGGSSSELTNCAIQGSTTGTNTINLNSSNTETNPYGPYFNATDGTDWSIKVISPCFDAGTDTDAPSIDYDGNDRISPYDIGAYEVLNYSRWTGTGTPSDVWNIDGNWDIDGKPTSSNDVVIPSGKSNYPTSTSSQDFTIGSGKYMIVGSGAQVTLGTLTNNGTLTLKSDADGIASLMVNSYGGTGTENIELFITGGGNPNYKWHYISSPVNNLGIATFTGTTTNLLKYDEGLVNADNASLGWRFYDGYDYLNTTQDGNTFIVLALGKGYDLFNWSEDHTFTFSGTFNVASLSSISLNYNSGSHTEYPDIHGLNLLGNPFTCSLDWDVIDNNLDANISKAVYYTKDNSVAYWVNEVGINGGTNIIPPMQGFFVKTTTDGTTITLPTNARRHDSQARYKSDKTIPLVRLSILQTVSSTEMVPPYITIDSLSDETVVRFDEQAKPGLDNDFDAVKMFLSDTILSIYSYTGETKYAINGLPFPEESINIPLAINSPKADTLKIRATQIEGLKDYDIILKDREQEFNINSLKYNEYIFFADSGTVTDRFILTVYKRTTGLPDIFEPEPEKAFNIYSRHEILYITPAKDMWNGKRNDLRIYDITGKIVKQLNNIEWQKGVTKEISLSVAQGIYLVEICSATDRFVGRVSVVR